MPDDVDMTRLAKVTTATATYLLFKLGIRNTFFQGIRPLAGVPRLSVVHAPSGFYQ